MNIFKELVVSVYDFKSYREFLKNKKGKVFLFGMLLFTIYFCITIVFPLLSVKSQTGGIPDFELKNGILWMEDTFAYEDRTTAIYIDTSLSNSDYSVSDIQELLGDYPQFAYVDSQKAILKRYNQVDVSYFSELSQLTIDRSTVSSFLAIALAIGMVIIYFFMAALFFLGVLFVALFSMIIASTMNYSLTFGQLFLLGMYARTLPLLVKGLINVLPIRVPYITFINLGISVLYVGLAISKMKEQDLEKESEYNSSDNNYQF